MKTKSIIILLVLSLVIASSRNASLDNNQYASGFGSGLFLSTNYAYKHDYTDSATKILANALEKNPKDIALLRNNYITSLYSGDIYKASFYAKYFLKFGQEDGLAQLLQVESFLKKRNYQESSKYLKQLIDQKKSVMGINHIVLSYILIWSYIGEHKYKLAKELAEQMILSKEDVPDEFMKLQLAIIYKLNGDNHKAKLYFDNSINLTSFSYYYTKLVMAFYSEIGDYKTREKLYSLYKKNAPYTKYTTSDNYLESDKKNFSHVLDANKGISEIFIDIAKILFASGISTQSAAYLNLALFIDKKNSDAVILLASYYESIEEYARAIKIYQNIDRSLSIYWLVQVYAARDDYLLGNKAMSKQTIVGLAKRPLIRELALITLADLLREDKNYIDAIKFYDLVIEDKKLNWALLFARGMCYEQIGDWHKAHKDLKQALELQPLNADLLNYLGYSLIDRNIDINKGVEMVELAYQKKTNDPQIMDSVGWGAYKLKKYDKAEYYIEKAIEFLPKDETVNDHLGDIYWSVGRKLEAKYQWYKAIKYSSDKKHKEKIQRKIEYGIINGA